MYRAADCQGFAGGFTLGMVQAGFKLVAKREMAGGFGVANCEANRHLLGDAWETEAVDPVAWSVPSGGADVVFGNPPCSGFSLMSASEFRGIDSPINHCMWALAEYAGRVKPHIAVFESVQPAFTQGRELMLGLRAKLEDATQERWQLYHVLHNAYSVGATAQRRRYFWIASRVPFGIEVPRVPYLPVLADAIGDLDGLTTTTWHAQPYRRPPTRWSGRLRSATGAVDGHVTRRTMVVQRALDLIADGIEWRPGEAVATVAKRYYELHGHLPPSWVNHVERLKERDWFMGFTTAVRWRADAPSRVVTGAALSAVIHPWEDRPITHREAARVLGFPDDWRIEPLKTVNALPMTWGKGITVDCGRWIGGWIRRALDGEPGSYTGKEIGERERVINVTHAYSGRVRSD